MLGTRQVQPRGRSKGSASPVERRRVKRRIGPKRPRGSREGLKARPAPIEDVGLREAQRKVGEFSMEVDILKALLEKKGHPPFPRRSK